MCGSRGGTGGLDPPPPPPLEYYKNIGFLSNTGLDPLKITKLPIQHSMFSHHQPASKTPFEWRFTSRPLIVKNDIYPEIVGQLHWIATQSRPDLCFDVLDLSTLCDLSESKLRSKINKVVRKAKYNQYKIIFPCLENIEGMELLLFTDASYATMLNE